MGWPGATRHSGLGRMVMLEVQHKALGQSNIPGTMFACRILSLHEWGFISGSILYAPLQAVNSCR